MPGKLAKKMLLPYLL